MVAGHWIAGEDWDISPFDADGVILSLSADRYHPVQIFQYGLHCHGQWIEGGDETAKKAFLAQARWCRDNQQERNGVCGCFVYRTPNLDYGVTGSWISAMAQGQAISLLLRAADVVRDEGFYESALSAAEPFKYSISDGGVVWRSAPYDVFLEELAALPASHTPNGNIYALWGLWELQKRTAADWLATLVSEAIETLKRRLPLFDSGYWSYYDLLRTRRGLRAVAFQKYHAFLIAQLHVMAGMTNDPFFDTMANHWKAYTYSWPCRLRVLSNLITALVVRHTTKETWITNGARSILHGSDD